MQVTFTKTPEKAEELVIAEVIRETGVYQVVGEPDKKVIINISSFKNTRLYYNGSHKFMENLNPEAWHGYRFTKLPVNEITISLL